MRLWAACAAALGLVFAGGLASAAPGDRLMDDLRVLSADDMQGRAPDTPGGRKARAYLAGRMAAIGLEPAYAGYLQPFDDPTRGRGSRGANVVGLVRGTGPSDRVLVITAHYDHLGVRGGRIFNGADDNASGVAALLAVAEDFKDSPPRHTTVFALVDAEETGSPGAKALLAAPPVARSRLALNLNFDMLGRGDKGELYVAGASHYPFLRPWLEGLARHAPVKLRLGHDAAPWKGSDDWTTGSDHRVFHEAGVPFAYFGVEDHPDYHRPTDDFEKIPAAFFRGAAETVRRAARLLDERLDEIPARSAKRN